MNTHVRSRKLVVLLSPEEHDRLCALADAAGLARSVFARSRLLYGLEPPALRTDAASERSGRGSAQS